MIDHMYTNYNIMGIILISSFQLGPNHSHTGSACRQFSVIACRNIISQWNILSCVSPDHEKHVQPLAENSKSLVGCGRR